MSIQENESEALLGEESAICDENTQIAQRAHFRQKLIKTVFLFPIWICIGICQDMNFTAVEDLKDITDSNYEQVSRALVAGSLGAMAGGITGGFLADSLRSKIDLLLGIQMVVYGVSAAAIPWCTSLAVMATAFLVQGIAQGAVASGGAAHCLSIWADQASSPLLFLHFGYAVGSIISPLMVAPFLSPDGTNSSVLHQVSGLETNVTTNGTGLGIPYGVSGGIALLAALPFFVFFLLGGLPPVSSQSSERARGEQQAVGLRKRLSDVLSPASCTGGRLRYGLVFFSLLCLFVFVYSAVWACFETFTVPIAISGHLNMSKQQAALMVTTAAAAAAAGRGICAVLARCVSITVVLAVLSVGSVLSLLVTLFRGLYSVPVFWTTRCTYAVLYSPVYAALLAWADAYVTMTAAAIGLVNVAQGSGGFFFTWLGGWVFQTHGATSLMYLTVACAVGFNVVMMILHLVASRHGQRCRKTDCDSVDSMNES